MGVTEEAVAQRIDKVAWMIALAIALVLNASGWFLPVADFFGPVYGGAGVGGVHEVAWEMIGPAYSVDSVGDVFGAMFRAIGWSFQELFILGIAVLPWRPRIAVRLFAFALGILIAWQIRIWNGSPLLIGYWFWVMSFAIMLWLAATNMARETIRGAVINLAKPIPLALLLFPSLIVVLAIISEGHL